MDRDRESSADAAARYRGEAERFRLEAIAVRAAGGDASALELTRMGYVTHAAAIERSLRDLDWPPGSWGEVERWSPS